MTSRLFPVNNCASIVTFGVYGLVWQIKSKRDLVALGSDIPTSWLLLVPFANLFWMYKWIGGYLELKGGGNAPLHFLGAIFFFPYAMVLPYFVQAEINKHAEQPTEAIEHAQAA